MIKKIMQTIDPLCNISKSKSGTILLRKQIINNIIIIENRRKILYLNRYRKETLF